ncbi:T9SS type A sorting domain-containing protein [Flavobacterium silvaticum]|uniref:T9SS type A sorting domain-containing protein n=1 Tax=Flavobacterium silvaticum TaxID=1852020 RepID=A0A972FS62_9FLAO|nr:T9SS type A sorting domain-containing protein [Flavobacterium silvaticum]NMH27022.1 T9SS type A sorting domain-containing protein [Flavobacterium silvaticum]
MKKLLLLFVGLASFSMSAQVTANQPANMYECGTNAVDLNTQIPQIILSQNLATLSVTFYLSEFDAQSQTNQLTSTLAYSGTQLVTVYVRVNNLANTDADFTSFKVLWNTQSYYPPNIFDVTVCDFYILPELEVGSYHTGPDGSGAQLFPGDFISNSTLLFVLIGDEECHVEYTYFIQINYSPYYGGTITSCTDNPVFDLNQATFSWGDQIFFYETMDDAFNNVNPILNTSTYSGTNGQIVYANAPFAMCNMMGVQPITLALSDCTNATISGTARLSSNGNDCSPTDPGIPGIIISKEQAGATMYAYTNAQGHYQFSNVATSGLATINVADTYPGLYNMTPAYVHNVAEGQTITDDFCLAQIDFTDATVSLYPLVNARPGQPANYSLRVFNGGSLPVSGTVTLTYDASVFTFVSSDIAPTSNTPGQLVFSFADIAQFGSVWNTLTFDTALTATLGQQVTFTAELPTADTIMYNNVSVVNQVIVNSFDPNDMLVAEGAYISEDQADGYLHYTINFQNLGTADAIDVEITNILSDFLDWSTFRPVASSHTYFTERYMSDVLFRFPDIHLPAEQDDSAGSHGYITYEIKPIAGLAVGDIIENEAYIVFDQNPFIATNQVTTQIQPLSVGSNQSGHILMYPNPAKGKVFFSGISADSHITVTDLSGKQLLQQNPEINGNIGTVDISGLSAGIYVMKLTSANQSTTQKLVIK